MDYWYYFTVENKSWNYSVERRNIYKGREAAWLFVTLFATELEGDVSHLSAASLTNQEYWHFQVHSDKQLWQYQAINYFGQHIVESALIPATREDNVLGIHCHSSSVNQEASNFAMNIWPSELASQTSYCCIFTKGISGDCDGITVQQWIMQPVYCCRKLLKAMLIEAVQIIAISPASNWNEKWTETNIISVELAASNQN